MSVLDPESARQLAAGTIASPEFRRATFAGPQRGTKSPWVRVAIRPVDIRGDRLLQVSCFDSRKDTTKNIAPAELAVPLAEILDIGFSGIHLVTATEEIDLRITKK